MATPTPVITPAAPARLAAGAAHDLGNLLFVVNAHCHRLLSLADAHHPWLEDLQAIRDASDRCLTLAAQILSEARMLEQPALPLDVNAVITGVEPLLAQLAGDRAVLRTSLAPNAWAVTANTVQIEQILMNLVVNARDAMPGGGTITLRTENRMVTGPGHGHPAQYVAIGVTDTGTGIEPAVQERMFDLYFTTKADAGGSGIGLATVRNIAAVHGGHVEVSTVPGQGTTFQVLLPRASAAGETTGDSRPATAPPVQKLRVLLVEPPSGERQVIERELAAQGHDVAIAASGAEALGWSSTTDAPADVVVASLFLRDINGLEVTARLREIWPSVRVVFLSDGFDPLNDLPPGVPVLVRPLTGAAVTRAIQSVIARTDGA